MEIFFSVAANVSGAVNLDTFGTTSTAPLARLNDQAKGPGTRPDSVCKKNQLQDMKKVIEKERSKK
jgi:hypothetical protein